jgi:hypothetical protein
MLLNWLRRRGRRPSDAVTRHTRKPSRPRTFRPQLETLEERQVPSAVRNLPGLTVNSLPAEDDAPSPQANVGFNLNFFGAQASSVFVNNNGNITFNQPLSQFTPTALNTNNGGIPIIAPFFADVDTRGAGSNLTTYGTDTLCGHRVFGVDWINVGYFDSHVDKLNSFQLILIDRSDIAPGNFDIEFNYDKIQWETGDASGGTNGLGGQSARVGFSNGSGVPGTFFELPGSGVNGAFLDGGPQALINQSLMATTAGRLHFFVRNGQIVTSQSSTEGVEATSALRFFHTFRYIFTPSNHTFVSNKLTVFRKGRSSNFTAPNVTIFDPCLDEVITGTTVITLGPPLTLLFPKLPRGVQLLNATGVTATGVPFLTLDRALPAPGSFFRVRLRFSDPDNVFLSTHYQGFPVRVIAGPFNSVLF